MTLRPAVPGEADALSRLALRSKGHWGYDEEFLATCRVELTLQPEQCDGVHTVVAECGDALLGFYRLAGEAPVAIRGGRHAATAIERRILGRVPRGPSRYFDKVSMATISMPARRKGLRRHRGPRVIAMAERRGNPLAFKVA